MPHWAALSVANRSYAKHVGFWTSEAAYLALHGSSGDGGCNKAAFQRTQRTLPVCRDGKAVD